MTAYDPHLLRPGAGAGLGQRTLPHQAGSAMLQAVIMTPVLVLVMMFAFGGGKLALAQIDLDGAAHAAARAATIERTMGEAEAAAQAAASAGTADHCSGVSIGISGDLTPGGIVTATLTCTVTGTGIGVLDGRTLTAVASSPVDAWRSEVP
ncbi:pilus assembly protein [Glycomyces sp. A-F 0318]|uniref:TadE/TadG family type IV pilus assembly protein n=1 Tax=Glycomyces amatae TaxID=2881355 RepID=UPI001E45C8CF|nr:TadE/TadG family type IV pilus assembly protein [Glycomyces amatae]MCD0444252.1 pilus assembly protein [Glycomyces amatae]